jgi:hypothetical protein
MSHAGVDFRGWWWAPAPLPHEHNGAPLSFYLQILDIGEVVEEEEREEEENEERHRLVPPIFMGCIHD